MTAGGDPSALGPGRETLAPLRALLELSRLVQREPAPTLDETLRAVAATVSRATGFDTVVVNHYLPETDEYAVVAVHGNERAQAELRDQVTGADTWTPLLDERYRREGVFFIPEGTFQIDESLIWHVPDIADPDALTDLDWHADDMLFATLNGFQGRHYGIIAVDDPASGRRPDDALLQVLATVAAHAALAIESVLQITELQDALTRNRAVITSALDAVLAVDAADRLIDFNPAAERMFGYRAQDVLGRPTTDLLVPDDGRQEYERVSQRIREHARSRALDRRLETVAWRSDGTTFPVELTITRVEGIGGSGPTFYAFVRDISERRRNEEQMAFLAYHDPLTGLPNRMLVEQELDLALARSRRAGSAVALMFVDLDDFKSVNDTLGHAIGDRFLTAVAARLKSVLRETDVLARQGGDEFLVLLPDLTEEPAVAAGRVAGKLLDALGEPFVVAGHELRTSASVGIGVYPDDARDPDELMRHADAAMYLAKGAGGRRLAFHERATGEQRDQRSLIAGLRSAVARHELELHYQPVRRLDGSRAIVGLEARLRWNHPERGQLDGARFMKLADQSEVGIEAVRWTIGEIARQGRAWGEEGLDPLIGLNVSPAQLLAPGFADGLIAALHDGGRPGRLIIELTESAWTVDSADALAVLGRLREAGIVLLLDDFGAGYSSLSRLGELAFDVIKLDSRLLAGAPGDPRAVRLLDAVVGLTRACQAPLVADGVDSDAQVAFLLERGISYGQGEALGTPQPAAAITPLLRAELVAEPAPHRAAAG